MSKTNEEQSTQEQPIEGKWYWVWIKGQSKPYPGLRRVGRWSIPSFSVLSVMDEDNRVLQYEPIPGPTLASPTKEER